MRWWWTARQERKNAQGRRGQVRPTMARDSASGAVGVVVEGGGAAALSLWLKRMGDGRRSLVGGTDSLQGWRQLERTPLWLGQSQRATPGELPQK
ncbi:hypothetical protein PMIN03_006379 [Paraphaeosphaeria minitans]